MTLDEAGGNGAPGHVDQHAIWIDPKNPKHLLIGNDGGFNVSWDQGRTWDFVNTMATALAYWVSADMRRPYYVYIGLQDNGSWGGPSATRSAQRHPELRLVRHRRRRRLPDGRRSDRLQHRLHRVAGRQHQPLRPAQRPRAEHPAARGGAGPRRTRWRWRRRRRRRRSRRTCSTPVRADQYRFNWNTPFQLSPHNPSIVWLGGNRLFKSLQPRRHVDRRAPTSPSRSIATPSRSWACPATGRCCRRTTASSSYSTIIVARRSRRSCPASCGSGTDDGNVQVSRDGGLTFTEVGKNLPGLPANHLLLDLAHRRVALRRRHRLRLGRRPSHRRPQAVPLRDARLRHRRGRASPATCRRSATSRWSARIRRTGTCCTSAPSSACIASLDGGKTWKKFMNNLPTARVDDILIHPRDNDLIVATHGAQRLDRRRHHARCSS